MKPPILLLILVITFSAFGQKNELISKRNFGELLMKQSQRHSEKFFAGNKSEHSTTASTPTYDIFRMKSVDETKLKLDSAIVWWMDEEKGELVRFMKRECYYNSEGQTTSEIQYFYNEDVEKLEPEVKQEYSLDAQGNILQVLVYSWSESNQWRYENKITNTFNVNNRITEQLTYNWNNSANNWIKDEKQAFSYDSNGNLTQELTSAWNEGSGQFVAVWKEEYSYSASGRITLEMSYYWDQDFNRWINTNKSRHTFNENNEKILSEFFSLNGSDQMMQTGKTEYTFSNGLVFQTMHYEWNGGMNNWSIVGRYDYTYDSFGNMEQELGYDWDESTSEYIYSSKINVSYDHLYLMSEISLPVSFFEDDEFVSESNHKVDSVIGQVWDVDLNDWLFFLKAAYYYSEPTVTLVNNIDRQTIKVFPNPVRDNLYISVPENSISYDFELFDISGHSILHQRLNTKSYVSLKAISPGMYLYRISSTDNNEMRGKLIKN